MSNFELVREFHEKFLVPILAAPTIPNYSRQQLRTTLIQEECNEVHKAMALHSENNEVNLASIAKELTDLLYVVYGTAHEYGIQLDRVFQEVHRSNMSKLGMDGRPVLRELDGKVLKGPNYKEAHITIETMGINKPMSTEPTPMNPENPRNPTNSTNLLDTSIPQKEQKNTCEFCRKDCSFFSFCDGCCIPCSDILQNQGWAWVIKRLVEGGRQVNELYIENNGLKNTNVLLRESKLVNLDPNIFPSHKASLSLNHNDHKDIHETLTKWEENVLSSTGYTPEQLWVSPEQRKLALENNDFWSLQWYPETPIEFHLLWAYDLNILLEKAKEIEANNEPC